MAAANPLGKFLMLSRSSIGKMGQMFSCLPICAELDCDFADLVNYKKTQEEADKDEQR